MLNRQVSVIWLLLLLIAAGAIGILWKVAVIDAPPRDAVLIENRADSSAGSFASPSASTATARRADLAVPPRATAAHAANSSDSAIASTVGSAPTAVQAIAVYVSGAVLKAGLYILPSGSRVADAVQAAGGPDATADLEQVNLAARVQDEEHISVPKKGQTPAAQAAQPTKGPGQSVAPTVSRQARATAAPSKPRPTGKVNINTAGADELQTLPSIGPVMAGRIIAYRQAHGPFATVDDLLNVSGIGTATLAKLRDLVTTGQ